MKFAGIIIIFFFIACHHRESADKTIPSDTVSQTSVTPQIKTKGGNFWDDIYNLQRNPITDSAGGSIASDYLNNAIKFPVAFFNNMDSDATGSRYDSLIEIISHVKLDEYNQKPEIIKKNIVDSMINNCRDCPSEIKQRINKFASDVVARLEKRNN